MGETTTGSERSLIRVTGVKHDQRKVFTNWNDRISVRKRLFRAGTFSPLMVCSGSRGPACGFEKGKCEGQPYLDHNRASINTGRSFWIIQSNGGYRWFYQLTG
jgi:hypothetical protein